MEHGLLYHKKRPPVDLLPVLCRLYHKRLPVDLLPVPQAPARGPPVWVCRLCRLYCCSHRRLPVDLLYGLCRLCGCSHRRLPVDLLPA